MSLVAHSTDLVGIFGAAVVVAAYFLNVKGVLRTSDWRFPCANLLGSAFILYSLVITPNLASILIELFWLTISIYGLVKSLRRRERGPNPS